MDKLGTHIVGLLNENSQVYLPGLGTFKKERVPASFDKKTNTFLAPTQRISFNTEKGSFTPLIKSISRAEEITDEESENQLNKIIDSILLELNEKGQYTIQHLGKLIKLKEEISFIDDEKKKGLPFYKDVNEIKLIGPSKKEPVLEVENKNEGKNKERIPPLQQFEPRGQPINWLWPLIVLLAVAIAGTLWYLNSQKLIDKESPAVFESSIDTLLPDTNNVVNLGAKEISSLDTSASASENKEPIGNEIAIKRKTSYEIIIVSFGKLSEAEKYVENMNAKGYKIRILENKNPGNLYKISYGSFINEAEAQLELNKVRETLSKDAWIYKIKNN